MNNAPTEPGIYWATKDYTGAWNYIIHVKGKVPFLSYDSWCLKYPDKEPKTDNSLFGLNLPLFLFGDKIDFAVYSSEEQKADKPGLYEVFGNRTKKLACLTGTCPYLFCWLWDINANTKTQHHTPWDLSFVRYIENPGDTY